MKKFTTLLLAIVMTAALCFVGCKKPEEKTAPPESLTITNAQTTLTAGTHTLTAEVKPANASQAVNWTLVGSPAGITIDGNQLTIAVTAQNESTFKVKATAQTDPTISDMKTFTVDNPPAAAIEISTEAELRAIELTGNYKLVNDIELTDVWTPLGEPADDDSGIAGVGYAGTFNGNGFKIKNFATEGEGYNKGMFYKVENTGVIENLAIVSEKDSEGDYVDGLNGRAWNGVIAGKNDGTIRNCYTDVQVDSIAPPAGAFLGTNNGTIENCYAIGPVKIDDAGGSHGAGFVNVNNGTITQSFVLETSVTAAISFNKTQNANIQKSENWMQTAQNYKDAGWSEDVWSLIDGYYPELKYEGYVAPAPKPVLNITNSEEYLDYNDEDQRELQITYSLSNVTDNSVTFALKEPVEGVSITDTGLVTLSESVADGAKFTVVVTSVEVPELSVEKTFTVNHADTSVYVEINTYEALEKLATENNPANMAKNYRLTADIDASEKAFNNVIAPITSVENDIGKATTPFTGIFDGNGYTISGFWGGEAKQHSGLFGEIGEGGVVKNLRLTIKGEPRTNRYLGTGSAGIAATNRGTIENVSIEGPGELMGAETPWVAGIAFDNFGTIKNCISLVKLSNDGTPRTVAGIACNNQAGGVIENCFVDTTVTGITQALNAADATLDAACIKTTAELQNPDTFAGKFDESIWEIKNGAYPTLKNGCTQPTA